MAEASAGDPEKRAWFTLRWREDRLELLDQRVLPAREEYLQLRTCEAVAQAIETLAVRGAPAIGCTAAFGLVCAARESTADRIDSLRQDLVSGRERLARTRPTAVNLFWALERMSKCWDAERFPEDAPESLRVRLLEEAQQIQREDLAACRAIGEHGLAWVPEEARILTHCNAGGLATAGYGTALGVVRSAHQSGRLRGVLADETRPFLQGARLTAWELQRDGIPVTVVTDGMAGHLMQTAQIDMVVVGADRIARNGDVANKIGTYGLAVLAEKHAIPMCVAAPRSTIDLETPAGSAIPIEERGRDEIANPFGAQILPDGVGVRHPAFDVTPAELVTAIITEVGVAEPPYTASLSALMSK